MTFVRSSRPHAGCLTTTTVAVSERSRFVAARTVRAAADQRELPCLQEFRVSTTCALPDGRVVGPGDADYDTTRSVWNGEIDRRPAAVARCADPADVAATIRFARDAGLDLTVRGGGHNFGGAAVSDGGVMIHLGDLNAGPVDPAARHGAVWRRNDLGANWTRRPRSTAWPRRAASISHTGVAGLTLGGGFGWLTASSASAATTCVGAEVVTADGRIVRASADEHPDLFWALRGGGGNFGVVTEFEFELHPVGPMVQLGLFFWDLDHGEDALRFAREFIETLPPEIGRVARRAERAARAVRPAGAPLRSRLRAGRRRLRRGQEHARLVDTVRTSAAAAVRPGHADPYTALQQMFDESAPWGILGYEKAVYFDELSDAASPSSLEQCRARKSPMSFMPIFADRRRVRRRRR